MSTLSTPVIGAVLRHIEDNSSIYDYVMRKHEPADFDHLHYLPYEQCPNCLDIGQSCYPNPERKGRWIFYCPYCYIHYKVNFADKREHY